MRRWIWVIGALGILNSSFTSCFTWPGTPERDGSGDKRAFIRAWCNGSTARKREKAKGQPTGLHLAEKALRQFDSARPVQPASWGAAI